MKSTNAPDDLMEWVEVDGIRYRAQQEVAHEIARLRERGCSHKWDRDGERCVRCGSKDWMGGYCTPTDQQPVAWMTKQTLDGKQKLPLGEVTTNHAYTKAHSDWLWIPLYTKDAR